MKEKLLSVRKTEDVTATTSLRETPRRFNRQREKLPAKREERAGVEDEVNAATAASKVERQRAHDSTLQPFHRTENSRRFIVNATFGSVTRTGQTKSPLQRTA